MSIAPLDRVSCLAAEHIAKLERELDVDGLAGAIHRIAVHRKDARLDACLFPDVVRCPCRDDRRYDMDPEQFSNGIHLECGNEGIDAEACDTCEECVK